MQVGLSILGDLHLGDRSPLQTESTYLSGHYDTIEINKAPVDL